MKATGDKIYTTRYQHEKIKERIRYLERKLEEVSREAGISAQFGDLIENAEFDSALRDERVIISQLARLKSEIMQYEIFNESSSIQNEVSIGSSVIVRDIDRDVEERLNIVGAGPCDYDRDEVQYHSLVGLALTSAKEGEIRVVELPDRKIRYKIIKISKYKPNKNGQ